MNENYEIFEEIFGEVMEENGFDGWWQLFDGEKMEEVNKGIAEKFGKEVEEVEGYSEWYNEMAADL